MVQKGLRGTAEQGFFPGSTAGACQEGVGGPTASRTGAGRVAN